MDQAIESAPLTAADFRPTAVAVRNKAEDAIHQLWGSVFLSPERAAPKTVVITSAEPREGVTQIAAALALTGSSGAYGQRVVLVEFNWRRPRLAQLFGLRPSPGVLDILTADAPIGASAVKLGARLQVLVAGQAAETLKTPQNGRMANLIQTLAEHNDHVIIDAPAVNRAPIAQTLAALTDGVLLVTKANVTRREAVAEAKKRIELAQGKVLGVVLNQRHFPIPGFLYRRL